MSRASDQITEYLSVGGLFNPELMNQYQHEAVRDTLVKARDDIQSLERWNAALREQVEALDAKWKMAEDQCFDQVGKIGELQRENAVLREQIAALGEIACLNLDDATVAKCDAVTGGEKYRDVMHRLFVEQPKELAALRALVDHAETLLCNSLPMAHCSQVNWDEIIRKWRDQKHAINVNDDTTKLLK